ncbi:MAG: hypothetical protein CFH00_00254 [Alphaproteobacteria bacterium MarineAlpha1_Bin1]|nr:MAG: hypothetical protein CFH00_00254 [Alphaproteobacteria bacterium MarineAlpha1_Bin1]
MADPHLCGFGGFFWIIQPGGGDKWLYFTIPLFTAPLSTSRDIVTRSVKGGASSVSILFYSMAVALAAGADGWKIADAALVVDAGQFILHR